MMQMPGQMRPDMPNIPQIKPSGMGQAAALPSEVEQLKRLPREQLMQALMSPAEEPPKWAVVTALDQQGKEADLKERAEGAAAQRQVAGLGTVAQEVAARPFARGGVVGFQSGGEASWERAARELVGDYSTPDPEAGAFWRALRNAFTYSSDVEAQRAREEDRQAQQERGRSEAASGAARGAARREDAAKPTPPTAPASTPPARRGLGTGAPARTPPPAATTSPPQTATSGFDIKDLQDAIRAAGTVSPEIQAARDALRTQREASLSARERRRAGIEAEMSEKPSMGLAALRIAQAAGKAKNLPEFFSLGSGAVADLQDAETKRLRELRRELMTMEDAEDSLREALAEKALAERSGDDAARKAADVKVFEAQRDYLDKQRTLAIQEQEVRARMTAAERSGSSGGESRGLNVQVTALRALIDSAQKEIDSGLLNDAQRAAAIKRKADAERQLAAIAAGFSNVSTEDLLKTLGVTGGAKQ